MTLLKTQIIKSEVDLRAVQGLLRLLDKLGIKSACPFREAAGSLARYDVITSLLSMGFISPAEAKRLLGIPDLK